MDIRTGPPHSVDHLIQLLYACRGASDTSYGSGDPVDLHDHALRTAALLRRSYPSDKELQTAGLVHRIGTVLRPGEAAPARLAADAVRPLLGTRVARLVLLQAPAGRRLAAKGAMTEAEASDFDRDPYAEDALTVRHAADTAKITGFGVGVLEDWRPVLELLAAAAAATSHA
ncbi:hypothetical protein DSC45_03635 [Streptomyces sp. YIM 130001]|uniref:metal-dependent phosphohydrolase n=1 Tax=Streptomyces sp. YIM 130001 TaxID=2259644 RepID=UPI000E653016|nr:metal-dependent phosphohydrolase [Streptomyces sp. YIM 130001]RII20293.1 hypothetical protein DSC45_03635 [Streptomyces sp. YIM 130001]